MAMRPVWPAIFCAVWLASPVLAQTKERTNLLTLASGAVVLEHSPDYGGGWTASNLVKGAADRGWCSPQNKPNGNYFIFELPQRYALTSFALDNTGSQDGSYPGISSRTTEFWVSTTGPDSGYRKVATWEATQGARKEFSLAAGTEAQWIKLVVVTNWGNTSYTELMKVEAYGRAVGPVPQRPSIGGIYNTNYGSVALQQQGSLITGCYYQGAGTLSGSTDGRTADMEWRQGGNRTGSTLMVLNSHGDFLTGVWYENGALAGEWSGSRAPGANAGCAPNGSGMLATNLKSSGRAILYGIHFSSDSADLLPESDSTLQQIVSLMKSQPALHIAVEGYTDSTNTDAYNLDLSRRRAQAVVGWLAAHGIAADRLAAQGYGKAHPVADNATPQGRALNRRVEIVAAK